MAPTFVQACTAQASPGSTSASMPSNVTLGNTLIAFLFYNFNDPGVPTSRVFSDSLLNIFGLLYNAPAAIPGNAVCAVKVMAAPVTVGGADTISLSTQDNGRGMWFVMEFSGLNNANLLDQVATNGTSTAGSLSIGPITTTNASDLLMAVICGLLGGTITVTTPSGYTSNYNQSVAELGTTQSIENDQDVAATGAYTFTTTIGGTVGFTGGIFLALQAALSTHSISGTISGAGGPGATVSYTGPSSGNVTADGSGNFEIDGLGDGDYVVTPTNTGFSFTPSSQNVTVSGADVTGVDFTSAAVPTVYSPVDSRDFATFPNQFRTVQGSKIYDVQTSSNPAVPGDDSRVAPNIPVDSRQDPNIPENSRAPQ